MSEDILSRIATLEAELAALRASLVPLAPLKRAASDAGFSHERVRQLAASGKIGGYKHGGRWLVCTASLAAYVRRRPHPA